MQITQVKLNEWSSPYLRQCSFACLAKLHDFPKQLSAEDLDCTLKPLSKKLGFQGALIPGKKLVTEWPEGPCEEDFETADEFDAAYDEWEPNTLYPKPWLVDKTNNGVEQSLVESMKWSINNKRYELTDENGRKKNVAFSHLDDEKREIVAQEVQHQSMVNEFALNASNFFTGNDSVSLFRSNHQLDIHMEDSVAECYEGCFFDETLAFASRTRILMVWIGHLRWYG